MKLLPLAAALLLSASSQALAAQAAPAAPPAAAAVPGDRVVLPKDVVPLRYEIRIAPDAARLAFRGQATITVQVLRPTDRIVLNAADLTIARASLSGVSAAPRVELDAAQQTAAFVFPRTLAPGAYRLSIDYAGKIYEQASGFFALDRDTPAGKQRALFTQFENSDARRFAPMWDEPADKAVFALTVEAPAGQMAVSNMPVAHVAPLPGGLQAVTFADTPKMSSYLLFLALGDFERIHKQVGATDVGVITPRGEAAKGQFALDAASELLGYYNDYFGVPFPLPKLDLIAGPGQSQFFGAMENWGAIFAFSRDLLVDPTASTVADRKWVYIVTAHEMAHQWFGDLVTMAWWDDLWLNEGFASWMENKSTDHFHPEWKSTLGAMRGREAAMELDAGSGTHPVITPIRDVFAAADAFDAITYQKGEAVIRMLEQYEGPDVFRAGIRAYIAKYAYGNTTSDQLWAELDRVSPKPVTQIAHDFTLQAGVPLIEAVPSAGGVQLAQSRFVTGGRDANGVWLTPVRVAPIGPAPAWLGLVSRTHPQLAPAPAAAAAVVNAGQTGYVRTLYAPELWARLQPQFPTLPPSDEMGLIFDSRALGEAGLEPMGDFLDLASQVDRVSEPLVLGTLAHEIADLADAYPPGPAGEAYRAFARSRLAPILARVGWTPQPGESDNTTALRADLVGSLGDVNDPGVIAESRRLFAASIANPGSLDPSLLRAVRTVVARHADTATWEQLHQLARTTPDTNERERFYDLLGAAADPALARRALELALSGEPPATTAPSIIARVGVLYPDQAFDFALAHRGQIEAMLEPTSRTIYFVRLAGGSRDPAMLGKLSAFAATLPASARGEAEKAASDIRQRQMIAQQRLPEVDRWLAAHRG